MMIIHTLDCAGGSSIDTIQMDIECRSLLWSVEIMLQLLFMVGNEYDWKRGVGRWRVVKIDNAPFHSVLYIPSNTSKNKQRRYCFITEFFTDCTKQMVIV